MGKYKVWEYGDDENNDPVASFDDMGDAYTWTERNYPESSTAYITHDNIVAWTNILGYDEEQEEED